MLPPENLIEEFYPDKGFSSDYLTLTSTILEVNYKNHLYVLPLTQIQQVNLRHIRLLFYFLAGGFILTLTLIAILKNFISPLYGMAFLLVGVASFYIGLKGKLSLQITTASEEYVFWFSGNYQSFQQFTNRIRYSILILSTIALTPPSDKDFIAD